MTEQSMLLKDQTGGESIALRDAFELDELSNPRIIPQVNLANLHFPSPLWTRTRRVSAADPLTLTTCPAELTLNMIECGDKTRLVVLAEFATTTAQEIKVSPIVYTGSPGSYVAIGEIWRRSLSVDGATSLHRFVDTSGQLSDPYIWNMEFESSSFLSGANHIALHITEATLTSSVDVWGFMY